MIKIKDERLKIKDALLVFLIFNFLFLVPATNADEINSRDIKKDDVKRVALEIKKGADVNKADWFGRTPLMKAARFDADAVCELLIKEGADVDATDKNGWTALMWAAFDDSAGAGKILIDAGADIDAKEKLGFSAMKLAESNENGKMIKLLEKNKVKQEKSNKVK